VKNHIEEVSEGMILWDTIIIKINFGPNK